MRPERRRRLDASGPLDREALRGNASTAAACRPLAMTGGPATPRVAGPGRFGGGMGMGDAGTGMSMGMGGGGDPARMCAMHREIMAGKSAAEQQAAMQTRMRSMQGGDVTPDRARMQREMMDRQCAGAPAPR